MSSSYHVIKVPWGIDFNLDGIFHMCSQFIVTFRLKCNSGMYINININQAV